SSVKSVDGFLPFALFTLFTLFTPPCPLPHRQRKGPPALPRRGAFPFISRSRRLLLLPRNPDQRSRVAFDVPHRIVRVARPDVPVLVELDLSRIGHLRRHRIHRQLFRL